MNSLLRWKSTIVVGFSQDFIATQCNMKKYIMWITQFQEVETIDFNSENLRQEFFNLSVETKSAVLCQKLRS